MTEAAIAVDTLVSGYGETIVLDGVDFEVAAGGTLAVLGRNGVGKSTLLNSLMGFCRHHSGRIFMFGKHIETKPTHQRNLLGIGFVPQEREIFPSLSVTENLLVAARPRGWPLEKVFDLFPSLAERRNSSGGRLSGGEQQMLAIGRALVGGPRVLLLDEPMEGLAPVVVDALYDALTRIRDEHDMTTVLVEQKAEIALAFAENALVLDRGKVVYRGSSANLAADDVLMARLLGVGGGDQFANGDDDHLARRSTIDMH